MSDTEQSDSRCPMRTVNLVPAERCVLPIGHGGAHRAGEGGRIWFIHGFTEHRLEPEGLRS